jgi:curved DNA-binding protein CbpA
VRIYHPQNNPQLYAEAHLQEINAAYEVLSDPLKRAAYDSIGIKRGTIRVQQGVSAAGTDARLWICLVGRR